MKRKPNTGAFTLVEVAMAIAVAAFAFVVILGLISVGIGSSQSSYAQTAGANVLSAIASDLRSTPNPIPKGSTATNSIIYKIPIPATGGANTNVTYYIGDDGQTNTMAKSRYQLNAWIYPAGTGRQETVIRLFLTWPAGAAYTNAAGSVESVVVLNRTP